MDESSVFTSEAWSDAVRVLGWRGETMEVLELLSYVDVRAQSGGNVLRHCAPDYWRALCGLDRRTVEVIRCAGNTPISSTDEVVEAISSRSKPLGMAPTGRT